MTVQRPGGRNRDGDRTPGESHTLHGVAIDPSGGVEQVDDRSGDHGRRITLYAAPDADIRDGDRVTLPGGVVYRVEGAPAAWRYVYTGRDVGVVVRCVEVTSSRV